MDVSCYICMTFPTNFEFHSLQCCDSSSTQKVSTNFDFVTTTFDFVVFDANLPPRWDSHFSNFNPFKSFCWASSFYILLKNLECRFVLVSSVNVAQLTFFPCHNFKHKFLHNQLGTRHLCLPIIKRPKLLYFGLNLWVSTFSVTKTKSWSTLTKNLDKFLKRYVSPNLQPIRINPISCRAYLQKACKIFLGVVFASLPL